MRRLTYISQFRRDADGTPTCIRWDPAFTAQPGRLLKCRSCGVLCRVHTGEVIKVGRFFQHTRYCPHCMALEIQVSDRDDWPEVTKREIGTEP